jgi:FtsZ-binding cell division protein ZapB
LLPAKYAALEQKHNQLTRSYEARCRENKKLLAENIQLRAEVDVWAAQHAATEKTRNKGIQSLMAAYDRIQNLAGTVDEIKTRQDQLEDQCQERRKEEQKDMEQLKIKH